MPMPALAIMLAALLTMTVPLTLRFCVPFATPPRKPALIPEGDEPLLFAIVPELMDPEAYTVTSAPAGAAIAVAWFAALIPELPDVMTSAFDILTAMSPGP